MTAYVITGARILGGDPADIVLDDGQIVALGNEVRRPRDAEIVKADGLVALPGLVDLHTHLREPGREDAETVLTGTRAAASPVCTRWRTPTRSRTRPAWSSRSGGSVARPATATSTRSAR